MTARHEGACPMVILAFVVPVAGLMLLLGLARLEAVLLDGPADVADAAPGPADEGA